MFLSLQSKLIIFFALISIIISSLKGINLQSLLGQIIFYYLIARNADCLIYGKCYSSSWISIIIPIIAIIIFVFDYLGYFKKIKHELKRVISYINNLNDLKKKETIIKNGKTEKL